MYFAHLSLIAPIMKMTKGVIVDATVTISGYVGNEPDYKDDPFEQVRFRLACTPRKHNAQGWADDATIWIQISCTGDLARNTWKSIHKGDPVIVTGKMRTVSWRDNLGNPQSILVIRASCLGHDLTRGITSFTKRSEVDEHEQESVGVDDKECA